jgi:ABC-type transport system involved in multi-copper enzyme maturation permease subunit
LIIRLAREELCARVKTIGIVSVVVFAIVIPSMSASRNVYSIAIPFIVAFTAAIYSQRSTYEDEKDETLPFLRYLPISPAEVVCSRALASVVVTAFYTVLALIAVTLAARFILGRGSPDWKAGAVPAFGIGLFTMAFMQAVYFRFGARVIVGFLNVAMSAGAMALLALKSPVLNAAFGRVVSRAVSHVAAWRAENPATAAAVLGVVAICAILATWAYAAWALGRKEIA